MYAKDRNRQVNRELNGDLDLREDLNAVKMKVSEARDAISQTARDASTKARDYLSSSMEDLSARKDDIQDNVVTYVKSNPVKAVGIAVIAGLIVSQFLRK